MFTLLCMRSRPAIATKTKGSSSGGSRGWAPLSGLGTLALLLFACQDDDDSPSPLPSPTEVPTPSPTALPPTPTPLEVNPTPGDYDGDGYSLTEDCNDLSSESYPGADERCDGEDNDCDEKIDESDPGEPPPIGASTYYSDGDSDGHGGASSSSVQACSPPAGYGEGQNDCDDQEPLVHPGAVETCGTLDTDCDGLAPEPDLHSLRQRELRFGLEMVSPNLGLPLDALTCAYDESSSSYSDNPNFFVFPQFQYRSLSVEADASCGGSPSDALEVAFTDERVEAWGLYTLALEAHLPEGCEAAALRLDLRADVSRYARLTVSYAWDGVAPASLELKDADGTQEGLPLPPTGGEFASLTLPLETLESPLDLSKIATLEFIVPEDAPNGVLELERVLFEASPEAYGLNEVTCDEDDPFTDLACLEPYTSTTNIGLYLTELSVAFSLGELEKLEAVSRAGAVVSHLMDQRGWDGVSPAGAAFGTRGWMQTWISPFSGMPSPYDKWISLLDAANLVAALMVADRAFDGQDPALEADISTLLSSLEWCPWNDGTSQYGGYLRQTGCGLADGHWESSACPIEATAWKHERVGDDTLLASFLSFANGCMTNDTWARLDCSLDEYTDPSTTQTFKWFNTGTLEFKRSDIPAVSDGGLYLPGAAQIFLELERLPVTEGMPGMNESLEQLLQAQEAFAAHYNLDYFGWSNCRGVDDCDYLSKEEVTLHYVAPYATLMMADLEPQPLMTQLCSLGETDLDEAYSTGTRAHDWGFRDTITQSGRSNPVGYLYLDKAWTYLGLSNLEHGAVVRSIFGQHSRARQAYESLPPLCAQP